MTEQEWLTCPDPTPMLDFLQGKTSDRKLRLFAFACERRVWRHEVIGNPIDEERIEQFVDGKDSKNDLRKYLVSQRRVEGRYHSHQSAKYGLSAVLKDDAFLATRDTVSFAAGYIYFLTIEQNQMHTDHPADADERLVLAAVTERDAESKVQASLLRDIFDDPFRTVTLDPSWRTPSVVNLADAIYDNHAFDCLPLLAGALEEAGCRNADLLAHCRGAGPHVRGCWVVDLILGKK